jgi:phosphoribosylaminoimidazole carboxylase (NCAIR synthetase)
MCFGVGDDVEKTMERSNAAWQMEHAAVCGYGKLECRRGRKMGHIHLTAAHTEEELDINVVTTKVTTGRCYNGFS